jgi:hypothetical protein
VEATGSDSTWTPVVVNAGKTRVRNQPIPSCRSEVKKKLLNLCVIYVVAKS